jgi:putative transposase
MLSVVADEVAGAELLVDLDELAREGARRMLAAALEAEVDDYLAVHAAERDERGRRLVVRNGHARGREVLTAAGAVAVQAPRVDDRRVDPVTGQRARFRWVILPRWCRRSPRSPRCCRCCTCTGCPPATSCRPWRGSSAPRRGCRPPLSAGWQADHQAFCRRDLSDRDFVSCWADGVHFRVRLEQARLCCLVLVGVRADGTKELVAVADGSASRPSRGRSCCAISDAAACALRW